MRRRHLWAGLLATAVLAAGACRQGAAPETSPSPAVMEGPQADEVTVQMEARSNSGQEGTATLTATPDGQTSVVLDLANSPAGPQPSHISAGTCDNLGETDHILGGLRGGKLQTRVDVSLDSLLAGEFAINIAKSPQEFGVLVSCGEVRS